MNRQISEKEAIFRFTKIFIAQYLSTVHNYDSFQNEAINMITHYLLQIMRSLALKVSSILKLQGRTLPNSLHLLAIADQLQLINFQDLLAFIIKRKEAAIDMKSLEIIERVGKKLFQNDLETVNNYEKEKANSNIRYIPPVFVIDLNKQALPYKHTVDDAFEMPPQITYQQTKEKIVRDKRNIELLSAYTKRENKIALTGRLLDEQRDRNKRNEREKREQGDEAEEIYAKVPEKKTKFNTIQYI